MFALIACMQGLMHDDPMHALTMCHFAMEMLREARQVAMPTTGEPLKLRVGMHSGQHD